jgi:hypothetical protein
MAQAARPDDRAAHNLPVFMPAAGTAATVADRTYLLFTDM